MRYLIYIKSSGESFFTEWFGDELVPNEPYVCFDLVGEKFTTDGKKWSEINKDHL